MSHSTRPRPRILSLLTAVMTLGALIFPLVGTAQANHGNRTLDVPQEFQEHFTGEPATFTATLSSTNTETSPINVDFEHEAGNNNTDGNTPLSPDLTCDVPVGAISCSVSYTGTSATSSTTPDRWRIWIDHDKVQTTVEADEEEGPTANRTDCQQDSRRTNCGDVSYGPGAAGAGAIAYQPGNGGTSCDGRGGAATGFEPDCTDVVQVAYNNRAGEVSGLDCDDRNGAQRQDTERETNPSSTDEGVSGETYRCRVTNQFGSGVNDIQVYGEVENGINDPDPVDGASYESPDYNCQTDFDDRDPIFGDRGFCTITVLQVEQELGTAEICFWTGLPEDGPKTTHCGDEPTGEAQSPDGTDAPNDLADQVEKTWQNVSTFTADCEPETDINPAGQRHEITCFARSGGTTSVSGVQMRMEISGAGDPDQTDSPQTPDQSCVTGPDGSCTFNHTSTTTGNTTYRVWIDDGTAEPRTDGTDTDVDRTEGQSESTQPGEQAEPDATDVVSKKWEAAPTRLQMTPDTDAANVGECNPFTITLSSGSGDSTAPVRGAVIDVEQRHSLAANNTASDEPAVDFCVPASGPNPSDVDTTRGDLGPDSEQTNDREDPDNEGTASGETEKTTDENGQITIGITVAPGQGSDGSGTVTVTAFFDSNNNDDPDASEPQDTSTKTWQDASSAEGRNIDCTPDSATNPTGTDHTVTCTVTNAAGEPVSGEGVTWTETGPGDFKSPPESTTDANGQAEAVVTSMETGQQSITATLTDDTGTGEPDDIDECDRAASDPSGTTAGNCSDTVTKTWQEGPVTECNDGVDNDNDGQTDFPDDPDCESAQDDDESPPDQKCPGQESEPGNHIVGTEGDDTLTGTAGNDVICGLGGNDLILGEGGDDLIFGGDGNDSLRGGDGNDSIEGEAGKDELRGNDGNDDLRGGDQNDDLRGNSGDDLMLGESGFDVLRGGGGDDEGRGGSGNDTIQGFTGKDLLVGNAGNDTIKGGGGRDELRGGKDDDVISGGRGPDRIRGGPGRDVCAGGAGNNNVSGCEA